MHVCSTTRGEPNDEITELKMFGRGRSPANGFRLNNCSNNAVQFDCVDEDGGKQIHICDWNHFFLFVQTLPSDRIQWPEIVTHVFLTHLQRYVVCTFVFTWNRQQTFPSSVQMCMRILIGQYRIFQSWPVVKSFE